jgi:DNA-directed RNA polymerase subunit RPC12/RpoP
LEDVKLQPRPIIKCPHCGNEYLAGEVLFPINMIGYPVNIVRDTLGHIIYEEYPENKEPLAEETYWCDKCEKPFIIEIEVKYKTRKMEEEKDFSNTSATLW